MNSSETAVVLDIVADQFAELTGASTAERDAYRVRLGEVITVNEITDLLNARLDTAIRDSGPAGPPDTRDAWNRLVRDGSCILVAAQVIDDVFMLAATRIESMSQPQRAA